VLTYATKQLKKPKRAVLLLILLVGVFTFLQCQAIAARSVTLAWNPSVDPSVAGYNVYWGTASGSYSEKLVAGTAATAVISGLMEGTTYYFVVTAYNISGLESDPSNEVSYRVPGISLSMTQTYLDGFQNSFVIASAGNLPAQWTLEASEDLITWKALTMGTNSVASVAVVVCDQPQKSFLLLSDNGGNFLAPQTVPTNAFPNSVYVTSDNALLSPWVLQASSDYKTWRALAAGTNPAVNVSVIASPVAAIFFRLRGG
jgi:hypothetical protein